MNETGGQGERDEDDPLLASMPTFAPGVVPGGVSQAVAQPESEENPPEKPASSNWSTTILISSILFGTGLIVFWGRKFVRKQ